MTKSKKIIIFLLIFLIFSNYFILPISSTRCFPEKYNYNEWHIDAWYEIYNVTKDMKVYGWTIIKINLTKPNVSNDIYFDIELPAKNDSVTYYYPNISGISLKREERKEGISVSFNLNRSVFMNCSSFEFAIKYTVREELFLNQKSQDYESFIRYRFETRVDILKDILLYKGASQDSRIINIYIFLNDEATIVKPEKFSVVSKDEFPNLIDLLALNRTAIDKDIYSEVILSQIYLPKIGPNENNTILISYIGSSSPGSILFEFSFTNDNIVRLTIIAVVLGIISFAVTIMGVIYKIYKKYKKDDGRIISISKNEEITTSLKIKTITSLNINRIEKLDSLSLAVPSLFGIIGIIIPLFANAISEQGYGNIFVNEILYYFTIPLLFFAVFMPLYIGYWRGAIIANSITERIRGWIYLILGASIYLSVIFFLIILIIFALIFSKNIVLVLIINLSIIIIFSIFLRKQMKKLHPLIKKLFIVYGQQDFPKKDEYLIFRTYLTTVSFSIFFYILFYSIVLGKILYSWDILYAPIRLIGLGIPILYFGLHEENITSNYLKNIPIIKDSFLRKKIKKFLIIMLMFSILSFILIIIDILFNNLFSALLLHICIGISIFSALTWVMENINLKYLKYYTKNENKSISEIININGIGPKTILRLENAGITTIKKLGEIDVKDLTSIKGVGDKTARLLKKFYNK